MKKYIKVKIKTILVILLLTIGLFTSRTVFWNTIGIYNRLVPETLQIASSTLNTYTLKNENTRLKKIIFENNYFVYNLVSINPGVLSLDSPVISEKDAKNVYKTFLKFQEKYNVYTNYPEYAMNVALIQWFSGDVEKTNHMMDQIIPSNDIKDDFFLLKAGFALGIHDFDAAFNALDDLIETPYKALALVMENYMLYLIGESNSLPSIQGPYPTSYGKLFSALYDISKFNTYSQFRDESHTSFTDSGLDGHVTVMGKPIQGAIVFVSPHSGSSPLGGFASSHQVTNSNGYYAFDSIYTETKQIGLLIPWHLIKDTQKTFFFPDSIDYHNEKNIDFTFEKSVQFDSLYIENDVLFYSISDPLWDLGRDYALQVTHTDSRYMRSSHASVLLSSEKMSGSIPLDQLRLNTYNTLSDYEEFDLALLPPLYLSGTYYFEVRPINRLRSNEYYTINHFFSEVFENNLYVPGLESMSQGDELYFAKKLDEAISAYETEDTFHAKKMLLMLYEQKGYTEKAHDVVDYFIALDPENTRWFERKSNMFSKSGKHDESIRVLKQAIRVAPQDTHLHYLIFKAQLYNGQTDDALETFENHLKGTRGGLWGSPYLFLIEELWLLDPPLLDLAASVNFPDAYEELFKLHKKGNFKQGLELLESFPEDSSKTFFTLLLEDILKTDTNYDFPSFYRDETLSLEDPTLKEILIELKKGYNWFY